MDEANTIVTKRIDSISFGVVSPAAIKKVATVTIASPELYDADGYPVEKGLMDLSMGVIDPGLRCKTCGGRLRSCPGHFGNIQLAKPIMHAVYAGEVHNVLKAFCGACGRIKLPEDKINLFKSRVKNARRVGNTDTINSVKSAVLVQVKKQKKCPHCSEKQVTIKLEKPTTFSEGDKRLWPNEIRERFEKIPDEDLTVIGMEPQVSRPEWMIITLLLVPPITMRPSITLVTGERSEDDLTHKLSDIVRVNQRLFENINAGAPQVIIEDLWDLLQYHITTYFDNSISQIPPARHKSNRPLKTLAERLKGKEGRFRYNLAGKRVNFCARSVISPDPFINIDEVGVPVTVAQDLTIPERVTEWNSDWLKVFIKNNETYPGARYVITEEGKRKKITDDTKEQILEELTPGWIVERHLLEGDVVLFNRQPSLHRLSLMGHKVRLLSGKTFRINPSVTRPYNADFDGDEMNLHVPQTEEARSEAENLLLIDKHIITPRYGLSIIGEVEDSLIGIYLLTRGDMNLTREQASSLAISAGIEVDLPKSAEKEMWNGRQIFSMLLPKNFNFELDKVVIKNGELIDGAILEKFIGPESGILIQRLNNEYGCEAAKDFINMANRLGLEVVKDRAYTMSFSDLDLPGAVSEKIKSAIEEGEAEVFDVLKKRQEDKIAPIPGKSVEETAEAKILYALNKARETVGNLLKKDANEENNLVLLSKCGMAGMLNLSLMSGFAGQMSLRGERIHIGYTNRTLSLFEKGDLSARARGFVRRGFAEGMDPIETFFNAIVGRDSLMDTAMRTPKSGYMQRRLINALQDLRVNYDATIRDANQRIVQFEFGNDSIDVSKSDEGGLNVKSLLVEK
ncbi:MAG: DNA-directed RNA polymerase subunit A' [DPANN group archaeon]|nr:DNA-directed RNA polymerase subunit A' [DPANN group archaeon]